MSGRWGLRSWRWEPCAVYHEPSTDSRQGLIRGPVRTGGSVALSVIFEAPWSFREVVRGPRHMHQMSEATVTERFGMVTRSQAFRRQAR